MPQRGRTQARLDRIEQHLDLPPLEWPPVDPPTDPHRVLIGAGVSTKPSWPGNWASIEAAVGKLQAVRIFDGGAATPPASMFSKVAGQGYEIHSSTKSLGTDPVDRLAYYQAVKATGESVVAYTYHEPDDNINNGEFSYEQWRAAAITDARACNEVGIPYGFCWQLWGVWGWPALIDRLVADTELLELCTVAGWDTYQRGNTEYSQATYRPWSYNGDEITALMERMPDHLQVAAPELGYPEHPTDAGYRPQALADMRTQAIAEQWRAILLYNAWKPAYPGSKHVATGPEFCYDTPECREASRVMVAALVAEGRG